MPALITSLIPESATEKVRDALAGILGLELTNQKILHNQAFPDNQIEENINVWKERMIPVGTDEDLYINVHLDSGITQGITQKDGMIDTQWFIDFDTSAEATEDKPGSLVSVERLHKYAQQAMYVLRTPYYRTLSLDGLVGGTYIKSFHIFDSNRQQDSEFTAFCRVVIGVNVYDDTETWQGQDFLQQHTTISFAQSEKGIKFVFNNT